MKDVPQVIVMAALTATLLFLPVGALLALLAYGALGISFHDFLTYAGALNNFTGTLAWWALAFVAAIPYTVYAMPWRPEAP